MPMTTKELVDYWHGLTPDEYAAIGKIAVESTYLEDSLERIICRLAKISMPTADILLTRAMLDAKLTIFGKLAEARLSRRKDAAKKLKELQGILRKARDCNESRTVAIHGHWLATDLFDMATGKPRRPRAWKKEKELDIPKAIALSEEIREARLSIFQFCLKTWPQTFGVRRGGAKARRLQNTRENTPSPQDTKPPQ